MPVALLGATLLGLYSKESALCVVPLAPLAALLDGAAGPTSSDRARWLRAGVAAGVVGAAFVFYVEMRRRWFPVATPAELTAQANHGASALHRAFVAALRWYAQPMLPHDPLNNPLINASPPYRVAGALRVYARGLGQLLLPRSLSGDYSSPQEPIPNRLWFPESVLGAMAMLLPLAACPVLGWMARRPDRRDLGVVGLALVWIVVSYIPVSNIPVVLPTVRAERFWYFPAIGTAILLARSCSRGRCARAAESPATSSVAGVAAFLAAPGAPAARVHAMDYKSDLVFWDATRKAVPRSAKAHLNYSVMLGARGDLPGRLRSNDVALGLAPEWPMANVYEGDTLCRMHRAPEALPHFVRGFRLGPNDLGLIALGLQCLYDEQMLAGRRPPPVASCKTPPMREFPWFVAQVPRRRHPLEHGEEYKGVNPVEVPAARVQRRTEEGGEESRQDARRERQPDVFSLFASWRLGGSPLTSGT